MNKLIIVVLLVSIFIVSYLIHQKRENFQTSPVCQNYDNQSSCDNEDGCSWNLSTNSCQIDCLYYDNNETDCLNNGCKYTYVQNQDYGYCDTNCNSITDSDTCNSKEACKYDNGCKFECSHIYDDRSSCDSQPECNFSTDGYCENDYGQPNTTSVNSTDCYNIFDSYNCDNQPGCKYITDPVFGGYCDDDNGQPNTTAVNSTDCNTIFDSYNCDLEPGCSYNFSTGYCQYDNGQPNTTSVNSTDCYNIFNEVNCDSQPGCKFENGYCQYDNGQPNTTAVYGGSGNPTIAATAQSTYNVCQTNCVACQNVKTGDCESPGKPQCEQQMRNNPDEYLSCYPGSSIHVVNPTPTDDTTAPTTQPVDPTTQPPQVGPAQQFEYVGAYKTCSQISKLNSDSVKCTYTKDNATNSFIDLDRDLNSKREGVSFLMKKKE